LIVVLSELIVVLSELIVVLSESIVVLSAAKDLHLLVRVMRCQPHRA